MKRLWLQFWGVSQYLATFLYLALGGLAGLSAAGKMPPKVETLFTSAFRPDYIGFLPPQFRKIWVPLAAAGVVFVVLARVAGWRKRLWSPAGLRTLPAPGGGYLKKAGRADLRKELEKETPAARRQATEFFKLAERNFASNKYREAAAEYQKSAFQVSTMSAYLNLGVSLCYTSCFQRATDAFEMGLSIAKREGSQQIEAAILNNSGIPQKERGKLTESLTFFKQAYSTYGDIGDSLGQACALGNIGCVYVLQGRTKEAMKSLETALESFEQAGCLRGTAATLDNLGNLYSAKWDFKRALKLHRRARRIFKEIRNLPGEMQTTANIGHVCCKLDKLRSSFKASHRALKLAERVGSLLDRARALGTVGLAYEKKGKLDDALESVQKSLELYKQVGSPLGIGNQLASIGVIYSDQEKETEAMSKFGEARSKFLQIGARSEGYHTVEAAIELSLHENP